MRKTLTDADRARIKYLRGLGISAENIGERIGFSSKTVYAELRRETEAKRSAKKAFAARVLTLTLAGFGVTEIAEKLHVDRSVIYEYFRSDRRQNTNENRKENYHGE